MLGADADTNILEVGDDLQDGKKVDPLNTLSADLRVALHDEEHGIMYREYQSEEDMPDIVNLITADLSEPYSVYTYRYFIYNWPKLCFLACDSKSGKCVGAVVGKLDWHRHLVRRGYIAMLAVSAEYRRRCIGSTLVRLTVEAMEKEDCHEVVLEAEVSNGPALRLYERLGFVRDKRLLRYYLNGVDAFRLKLWLQNPLTYSPQVPL